MSNESFNEQLNNGLGDKLYKLCTGLFMVYVMTTFPADISSLKQNDVGIEQKVSNIIGNVDKNSMRIQIVDDKGDKAWSDWITGPGHPLDPVQNSRLDKLEESDKNMEEHLRDWETHYIKRK